MPLKKGKVTIRENKSVKSPDDARFFLTYEPGSSENEKRQSSYQIISSLKQKKDLLVEINSSLLTVSPNGERENFMIEVLRAVKDAGLNNRYRKLAGTGSSGSSIKDLFSFGKKPAVHELFILVPDRTWQDEVFQALLPLYGVRYYVCSGNEEPAKLMDELFNGQILEEDKFNYFNPIIFDCSDFGHSGIFTDRLSLAEVKNFLGI
jgi:hypothetical protein